MPEIGTSGEHTDFRDRDRLFHRRRRLFLCHAADHSIQAEAARARAALDHFIATVSVAWPFAVPVIVLEPAKPLSGYLIGTGHFFAGAVIFIAAEVVKLTVVERLFQLNKEKLLSIPAFAWGYRYWRAMMDLVESLEVWKAARRVTVQVGKVWRAVFHRSRDARSEPRAHGTRIVRSRVS
jgi:hypothetical protein